MTIFLLGFALLVTFFVLDTISSAWVFLIEFGAGTGFALILRWYWWRITAATELASMLSSMVMVLLLKLVLPLVVGPYSPWLVLGEFPYSLFIIVIVNIRVTLWVAYRGEKTQTATLIEFYKRVRPAGPGWDYVRELAGMGRREAGGESLLVKLLGWLGGVTLVYCLMFATGAFLFGNILQASVLLLLAILSAGVVYYVIKREFGAE